MSSVKNLAGKVTVPEAPADDALAAMNTGYGQLKLAVERILVVANRRSYLCLSSVLAKLVAQAKGPPALGQTKYGYRQSYGLQRSLDISQS
ncbi:hypothetical protein F4813DRAFT_378132 [Daldinia decipiens]|uniref:uncharacterized protein n=1 Tax=Daldinia decipiens TaxID=326647 RepID=UPI0020C58DA2|nr:uncharacterized protein F4813DRAFT_378132 [Daldinia decipiens]KAI1652385.1 hypothetical protein F4813DRAFT_378132 [Daldinia decipiens]